MVFKFIEHLHVNGTMILIVYNAVVELIWLHWYILIRSLNCFLHFHIILGVVIVILTKMWKYKSKDLQHSVETAFG